MLQNRPDNVLPDRKAQPSDQNKGQLPPPSLLSLIRRVPFFLIVIVVAFLCEKYAPDYYKLSAVLGRFEGDIESHSMNSKLESTRAMVAAQEQEKAKAELGKQLVIIREQNILELQKQQMLLKAQNDLELQKQLLVMRQQVVSDSAKTQIEYANAGQLLSAFAGSFGRHDIAEVVSQGSEAFRAQAMQEVDQEMQRGLAYMSAGSGQPNAVVAAAPVPTAPRTSATLQPVSYQQGPRQGGQQALWQQRDKEAIAQLVFKVVGPGFECKNVKLTKIEELLCYVPELARHDEVMARVYASLKKNLDKDQFAEIKKGNRVWLKKRNTECQAKDSEGDSIRCLTAYTDQYRDVLLAAHHQLIGPFLVER